MSLEEKGKAHVCHIYIIYPYGYMISRVCAFVCVYGIWIYDITCVCVCIYISIWIHDITCMCVCVSVCV